MYKLQLNATTKVEPSPPPPKIFYKARKTAKMPKTIRFPFSGHDAIGLERAAMGAGLDACLLSMTASGALELLVLGTEPSLYGLPASDAPAPLDFSRRQQELRSLQVPHSL